MFADWRRIALPVASFSEEEVKEVKGLVVSPYTSLQFLELELVVRITEKATDQEPWQCELTLLQAILDSTAASLNDRQFFML